MPVTDHPSMNSNPEETLTSATARDISAPLPVQGAFMPYPVSTLSPKIIPNDLTNFKSRGVTHVQKETAQKLSQLRDEYYRVVDEFNWNKLIYESDFGFEPVIGHTYHLYKSSDPEREFILSLVEPHQWQKPFIGSFALGADGRWIVHHVNPNFSLQLHLQNKKSPTT